MFRVVQVVERLTNLVGTECQCDHCQTSCMAMALIKHIQCHVGIQQNAPERLNTAYARPIYKYNMYAWPAGTLFTGDTGIAILTDESLHGIRLRCDSKNVIQVALIDPVKFKYAYLPEDWLYSTR